LATATVAELLRDRATEMPDSPFFRCERDWISYLELDQRSKRLAASLAALGVERGDRVAILATNRDAHAELLFAAAKGAMIHVPLNPYLKEDGLMHQLQVTTPRAVIADEDGYAMLERLWPRLSGFVAHVVAWNLAHPPRNDSARSVTANCSRRMAHPAAGPAKAIRWRSSSRPGHRVPRRAAC